jgi:hypothetical protein
MDICVLFNDAVNCKDYTESVIDELMSMEHEWNDEDGGKLKYLEKDLSHCHFSHH